MPQLIHTPAATIASGASLSNAVEIHGAMLTGIQMPAAWTAANLTFQVSNDNSTFNDLYDDTGTEVTVIASTDRRIRLEPSQWAGIKYLKVRSGTAGVAVNQLADRTLYLELWE